MATNFPGSLDNATSLPYPTAVNGRNAPSLAQGQDNQNDAVIATETKLGTGASTPTLNNLLIGTGVGTSSWSKAAPSGAIVGTTDSQTLTNKTLTSPTINSPVITNATISADSIVGFTTANSGTIYGIAIAGGQITGANTVNGSALVAASVPGSALVAGSVGNTQLAAGVLVQTVAAGFNAVATGTTVLPVDDTIPQITEGDEYMTVTITPKSTTNVLVIQATALLANSAATPYVAGAIFQNSVANAIGASVERAANASDTLTFDLTTSMVAGTTSAITFRFRAGGSAAGTTTFNGQAGGRLFGAITKSELIVWEYKA